MRTSTGVTGRGGRLRVILLALVVLTLVTALVGGWITARPGPRQAGEPPVKFPNGRLSGGKPLPDLSQGRVAWAGDFDTGSFSQWSNELQVKASDRATIVTSPVRGGRYAARFEVEPGDSDVAGSGTGERSEVWLGVEQTGGLEGLESWWTWSVLFPSDFTSPGGDWNYFTQFHHTGTIGQSNIAFVVSNGSSLRLIVNSVSPTRPHQRLFSLGRLVRGVWTDFVFHVKWSADPHEGFVEVWVDGANVVPLMHLATLYAGQEVYVKQGYYRAAFDQASVVYIDGTRRIVLPPARLPLSPQSLRRRRGEPRRAATGTSPAS
jgi:Polysaccharide lyase